MQQVEASVGTPEYQLISEVPADRLLSWLDRASVDEERMERSSYAPQLKAWRDNGVLILENFIPKSLREPYFEVRQALNIPGGWADPCPYLYTPELRALATYPALVRLLDALIGYEMGLHLNLTGWVSSERAWHQDDYLNPDFVNSHYAAVWIALRDISPDSGPFEYVAGSHKWPLTRRDKVLAHCPVKASADDPAWPLKTQDWVSEVINREIAHRGAKIEKFIAKEGDVLIWHGRTVHRGSLAKVPGMPRHSLIAHYSAIEKRLDMRNWKERCFIHPARAHEWK
jgi:Phytanoyl-CoA dioxygenase (PhyH)